MGSTPVWHSVSNVKAVVAAFNQEKALVGAFSVITNLRMELFEAIVCSSSRGDSYLISLKDLLLRVLAVEDEAGLCHILSCCLHVWAGGGGGGEGEHGTGYTSLISSQSSSMDGKLGK